MAELYAKPFQTIETGYNPEQPQGGGQQGEMEAYLSSLPPEERQAAIERINAPLTGEELALMAESGQKLPTVQEYAEIEKWHKNHEISFIDGLGKLAEGGEQVFNDLSNAFASFIDKPLDSTQKMPATAVEAFAQGTRNFYGMMAQSQNTDSVLFKVKDFLNGTGTIEDRYNQYLHALKFNKDSADLASGKTRIVMDADMINPEITQAMAYIADPTLFVPFGKVASTGLRAVGLGEKLTMAGAKAAAIKNGIIGGTIKWGAGQPLEFLGGAVRNTIDYGLEKAGAAFEATTGIGAKEFAQTARMSGVGFSASAIAGHAVPYASTLSDAYLVGSSARGFGEALTLMGETMSKNKFGRGINSWAAEALEQAEKSGVALSPHAKGLLKALNAVDPLFAYGWNGLEGASEGAMIGGILGYASGGEEGMYSGIGAGMALGGVGATAGKVVADVTGGTAVARRAVQAKMVIEGHKTTNPEKAMFFEAMQKATEASGKDVDLVNGIIAGIDKVAPNFEFHALTPEQFRMEAIKKGYDPLSGKFEEFTGLSREFGADRPAKSKAMYILRSVGGDFVGDSKGFLAALKKASAKDSANPNKPASNIPANLRKYTDVAKTFEKLTKTQKDAILREIDGQNERVKKLGGKQKLREHYDALSWSEAWTDSLVKKFESDREGARKDIVDMLAQETKKNGERTLKGQKLVDKLTAEGFLDRDGNLLRKRNLHQADMTLIEFASSKGGVMRREADGKTHMYINLNSMGDETFPHELFHTIMRESPMKKHFTDSLIQKLVGTFDDQGKLVRSGEVSIEQIQKFFQKYIDLTSYNEDGTLNIKKAEDTMGLVKKALAEFQQTGGNKKISDESRSILEHYTEEFGAYYFSHWLMGRNRNTLFFGGELKGIEGLVERTKDAFKDFWQSKVSKANPEFDFSRGLNESFNRSEGLGRIASIDYYMRDMLRAASNANKDAFRPDSMTLENLRDFERSNGLRNLTAQGGNRRLNPAERTRQNRALGKEGFKILSGLDKNLRTSKDTIDENGKPVITGRLSEAELDALVKGGIVPRAWADKVNQGYAMLDGTVSNIYSAGYLGFSEQTTDASYPRLYGKDVAFKNRKAVLFDIETKIKADGTFYTLFHNIDLAVVEQRGNHLWQNTDYRNLWNGDRGAMEADFFAYISNASKASTDITKQDSATLLEKGDGLGAQRRDVLQQMAGMALQTGDAYKHQPIAVIPEGIRHSVTTFNIDGLMMPRVEQGARYDIDMGNAHKFIRENWQPDDMRQEKTPAGRVLTHESGFKFTQDATGKVSAYTSAGAKIGTFNSIKEATIAGKNKFNDVYKNHDAEVKKVFEKKNEEAKSFQALDSFEREEAIRNGDLFSLQRVKDFIGNRKALRQTREEFIISKAQDALESPELFEKAVDDALSRHKGLLDEYTNVIIEINNANNEIVRIEDIRKELSGKLSEATKERIASNHTNDYRIIDNIYNQLEATQFEVDKVKKTEEYLVDKKRRIKEDLYRQNIGSFASQYARYAEMGIPFNKEGFIDGLKTTVKNNIAPMEGLANGGMQRTAHSSVQGTLFAHDFDSQFKTGQPIVVIGTHGTKNSELMISRILLDSKLGTRYGVAGGGKAYSSDLGHFMGGSTDTSSTYAKNIEPIFKKGAFDAMHLSELLGLYSFNNATPEARYYKSSLNQYAAHVQEQVFFKLDRVEAIAKKLVNDALLSNEQKSALNLEAIAILDFLQTRKYIDNEYKAETLKRKISEIYSDALKYGNPNRSTFASLRFDIETVKKGTNVLEGVRINPDDIIKDRPSDEQIVHSLFAEEKEPAPFAVKDSISDPSEKIKFGDKEIDFPLSQQLYNNLINDTRQLMIVTNTASLNKIRNQAKLIKEGNKYVSGLNAKGFPSSMIMLPKMQLRMMMAFDNPKVIIDPRGYDESTIAPQMLQAIREGHDGVIFKRFADGGDMDDVYIQLKGGQDRILTIDSSLDPQHIPRKDEQGNTLKTGRDLKLSLQPDEPNAPKQVKGIQLDMTKAYDVFRQEYEESTGQSWSKEKFMQRASNWQFFGDDNGFVAVRPQRSGFVKLVGMAGDNKSKLRGIQQLQEQKLPVWGMVSKDIKDIAVKRGMREPNMIERTVLKKALNSAALGDAEILGYTSDNGVRLRYPDVGEVTKYMIGSQEYYQKLRSDFGDQIKSKIGFQPDDEAAYRGGRTYNQNSKQWKAGFLGLYAEQNPDRIKGLNLQFMHRADGSHRIRLTDNSKKGESADVGHITANISGDTATLSSHINEEYRGRKLAYVVYSEMAERLRAMGVTAVDGTIVNPDGVPVKVREKIIGDTRDMYSGRRINYVEAANRIQDKQALVGSAGGVDVTNTLFKQARYQPDEAKDYRGSHRAPSGENGEGSFDAMDRTYPEDLYSANGARYYGDGQQKLDKQMHELIMKFRGKPDAMVTVYRAVPKGKSGSINAGDWVTPLRAYAFMHGERWNEGADILEKKVPAGELFTEGNSIYEFGWSPKKKSQADILREEIASTEKWIERSKNNAPIMWERKGTKIYGHRIEMERRLSSLKYELNQLEIEGRTSLQPDEPTQNNSSYKPNQERAKELRSLIDSIPHYKEALESGQLTIDEYNPEAFKGLQVLAHAPDTASTVGTPNFIAQGGMGYPLLFKGEGWASVSRGLEKRLNRIGEANFQKTGKWQAPMALIMAHPFKMSGARNGAEGFVNVLKRMRDRNIISDTTLTQALKYALERAGVQGIGEKVYIGDMLGKTQKLLENSTSSGFKARAKFVKDVSGYVAKNSRQLSNIKLNRISDIIPDYPAGAKLTSKELIPAVFDMFVDPLLRGVDSPDSKMGGKVYAYVLFDKPLIEHSGSPHKSYNYSVKHNDNSPVRVDILSNPVEPIKSFTEKTYASGKSVPLKESTITNDTGQRNFPYGQVKHAQPIEYTQFSTEQTASGRILKNAKGYAIMMVNNKFRVYSPAKALLGVYSDEEQAKSRIYKEIPKQ